MSLITCARSMAIRHTSASVVVATRTLHTSRAVCMASGPHVFEATDADFEQKVVKSSTPVLVDFYADWCGPCRVIGPVLEKAVESRDGAVKLAKVNVDDNQHVSLKHKVHSIPLVVAYANGKVVDQFTGVRDPAFVSGFIDKLVGGK